MEKVVGGMRVYFSTVYFYFDQGVLPSLVLVMQLRMQASNDLKKSFTKARKSL